MALIVHIKARAERQIEKAAAWWSENRTAAPEAFGDDLESALDLLVEQPEIGMKVENAGNRAVRRLYLTRIRYFLYYRVKGDYLEVVAFWHGSRESGPTV